MEEPVVIRADAGAGVGTGHLMRCAALAQAIANAGGSSIFLVGDGPESLLERLESKDGIAVERIGLKDIGGAGDIAAVIEVAGGQGAKWVVVDGYRFGTEYQEALRRAGHRVLLIDDTGHCDHYAADVVLNHNLTASSDLYDSRGADTLLLLGGDYFLLREEFSKWIGRRREVADEAGRVLVTLGGEDPANVTGIALEALEGAVTDRTLEVQVILGAGYGGGEALQATAASTRHEVELLRNVEDMAARMAWADFAIAACGVTCQELVFMQTPAVGVVVADNQATGARTLDERGAIVLAGDARQSIEPALAEATGRVAADAELRRALADKCRGLIDGRGAERVAGALLGETEAVTRA